MYLNEVLKYHSFHWIQTVSSFCDGNTANDFEDLDNFIISPINIYFSEWKKSTTVLYHSLEIAVQSLTSS